MYNLSKGPCKINVQSSRRGGYSQQLENNSEVREIKKDMSAQPSPRPYFQATNTSTIYTQEHMANVRMLSEAWKKTERQLNDHASGKQSTSDYIVVEYVQRGVDPSKKNLPNAMSTH